MKELLRNIVIIVSTAVSLHAADAAAILSRVDVVRSPLDSFSVDIELTSYVGTKSEQSRFRVLGKGDDRSVVEFTWPQREKGKALLMLRDAMWIYIPSAAKPIRISPLQRLMGQASNGDVARTNFSTDYTARSATLQEIDGKKLWLLDLQAKDPQVAYRQVQLWVDHASNEPRRADFYVASGKLVKRARYLEYGPMAGHRTLQVVEIEDRLRTGHRTVMKYSNLTPRSHPHRIFTRDGFGR